MKLASKSIRYIYDSIIRPFLPYKISVHNGVPVRGIVKLFDLNDVFPQYEQQLVGAVRNHVETGDDVVIVGGGLGVSTVVAAQTVGTSGKVTTYEGSYKQYNTVIETVNMSSVEQRIDVEHAVVGSYSEFSVQGWGNPEDAEVIAPESIPKCDVLELDCEGAEKEILSQIKIRPEKVIVETHGFLDSNKKEVTKLLQDMEYEIIGVDVLDSDRGIHIITAERC